MTEPLFGSVAGSQIWPSAGVGQPQMPIPFGNIPIGASMQGFGSPQIPQGFGSPQIPQGFGPPQIPQGFGLPQIPQGFGSPQIPMMLGGQPMEFPPSPYGFPQAYGFSGQIPQPPAIGFGPSVVPTPGVGVAVGPHQIPGFVGFPALQELSLGANVTALVATIAFRRRQPLGPTNDQEIEEFVYDTLELLPGTSEVEVRCEGGRVTLTGGVPHKRLKRDVGEIAWTIPGTHDVQNNVTIATRRRARGATRESEPTSAGSGRKQG